MIKFVNKIKGKIYEGWHVLFCDMEEFSKKHKIDKYSTSTRGVQQNTDHC